MNCRIQTRQDPARADAHAHTRTRTRLFTTQHRHTAPMGARPASRVTLAIQLARERLAVAGVILAACYRGRGRGSHSSLRRFGPMGKCAACPLTGNHSLLSSPDCALQPMFTMLNCHPHGCALTHAARPAACHAPAAALCPYPCPIYAPSR
jgi:hypothetical protein